MVDHITIGIAQSPFMLQEAVQMNRMGAPDHLLSHYKSLIDDMHDEHHMNEKDMHFRKYELELPLWDIHLCQIWNL